MANRTQLLYIHGGMTFKTKDNYINYLKTRNLYLEEFKVWSGDYIREELKEHCQIIAPKMPRKEYSQYEEWEIHVDRHLEMMDTDVILVGWSLGGIFLAKYLSENRLDKNIIATYLIAPPFDGTMSTEDLAGGFELKNDLSLIEQNCNNINIWFSKDDEIIPIEHADKYKEAIPSANIRIFESKGGHFVVEEFPELTDAIKKM
jgi:hypothetical protein